MMNAQPSRRTVLAGSAAAATAGIAGVGGWRLLGASGATAPAPAGGPKPSDWNALARAIDGSVVRRNDADYDEVRRLFDPRFDRIHPRAVVEATSAGDVSTILDFVRKFDLKVRAKAGGHSYVGASTVGGGLVIDVGRIKAVHYSDDIANVGAGARLYNVHAKLAKHGRTIPTGTCPTVGAAGLTLGGGIGVASREHGLTSDQVTGLTIVTADGDVKIASHEHNRDLFWACRGGGGGNFGIVTSIRYDTQPARRMGFFLVSFPWANAASVIQGWSERARKMKPSSWANLHLEASSDGSTSVRAVGVCRAGDEDAEAAALESAVGVSATSVSTFQKSFLDGIEFLGGGTTSARTEFAAGSDVVKSMTRGLAKTLAHVIKNRARAGHSGVAILDPLTGAVGKVGQGATAFPWRDHLCDIQWYVGLPGGASHATVAAAYDWIRASHGALGSHSAGGYVNYLEPGRPIRDYYGANFARLRAIKHKHDPGGVFTSPYTID